MNKASLLTLGKRLNDGNLYFLSIHDLEPSGVIVHAYDQVNSKEFILPVTEHEFIAAGYTRDTASLSKLIESIDIVPQGDGHVLQSSNESISKIKQRLLGVALEDMVKSPLAYQSKSLHDLIVQGLVELCKEKPVGLDAVKWLGEWFLANNPNKPCVLDVDEEE
eukprot:gene9530-10532_t